MKQKTVNLIFCAFFTAIISVCAQILIPTPFFPITLQTFGIALCGYTLGTKNSSLSVLAYILLGVLGAPVFSGFCGGFHHITDPGGGFVVGFLPLAAFCGMSLNLRGNLKKIFIGLTGVVIMYCFGMAYFCAITKTSILGPVVFAFVGVFIKDILVLVLAFYLSNIIRKRIMI